MIGLIGLLGLSTDASAAIYQTTVCVDIATAFMDNLEGDRWMLGGDVTARGVQLFVDAYANNVFVANRFNGYVDPATGCVTVALSSLQDHKITAWSTASVNGVPILVYTTPSLLFVYGWQFYPGTVGGGYRPTAAATVDVVIPAQTASAQLAVASLAMWLDSAGLDAGTPLTYDDTQCCNGGYQDRIEAATFSRSIIAHETGHGVYRRRDGGLTPIEDQGSATDGCDGEYFGAGGHTNTTKEWYSTAIKEGMADFYSAWLWNEQDSTCEYDRQYGSDFDLDGVNPFVDRYSCEGTPTTGLLTYVSSDDWLEDLVNANDLAGCSGTLSNRSTQYDVLRYAWDLYSDQSVPFSAIVDIVDAADPHSWNATTDPLNPADDPLARWEDAALANGYFVQHLDEAHNGMDH